ncbi:MAG: hypothetical protein AAGI17_02830 [Planctomycetota bacterium]
MRAGSLLIVATLGVAGAASAQTIAPEDIRLEVGSGANMSFLVIDWNNGAAVESVAYAYRYDGVRTGQDMLFDVLAADPTLSGIVQLFDFGLPAPSPAVLGFGLDVDGDGLPLADGTTFDPSGLLTVGLGESRSATTSLDADDNFIEDFSFPGFWGFFVADSDPFFPGAGWGFAPVGFDQRLLSDGSYDGYSFQATFDTVQPGLPPTGVFVPSPAVGAAFGVSGLLAARRRRD